MIDQNMRKHIYENDENPRMKTFFLALSYDQNAIIHIDQHFQHT